MFDIDHCALLSNDMTEFVEESFDPVEFSSTFQTDKHKKLKDVSCETEALLPLVDQNTQTNKTHHIETQTEFIRCSSDKVDDKKLAAWLKHIYPIIEAELLEGVTQLFTPASDFVNTNISVDPYQKLVRNGVSSYDHSTGAAAWLAVRMNNAPALVLSSSTMHQGWCEHVDQTISLFVPSRVQDFVVFTQIQTVPVKACIQHLCTNPFNKNMFAGVTVTSDLYIWECISTRQSEEVQELFCETVQNGSIIGMDWLLMDELLTCHSDGSICLWKVSKEVVLDRKFKMESSASLTALLALSPNNFIVGLENGQLFLCSSIHPASYSKERKTIDPVISELEKHTFQVTSIFKSSFGSIDVILSCDLSGELFVHDMRNYEDGPTLLVKMPLPFKTSIACSKDTEYIFSPGNEGTIEIFRLRNGNRSAAKENFIHKESVIKISENGAWIVIGVNEGAFQIFAVTE